MEGGRREIDLLFPFGGFDVDDVLDCQGTWGGGGRVLIPAVYSFPQLTVFFNTKPRAKEVGGMVPLSLPAFLDDSHSFLAS